jgi:hypothetical protein
MRASAAAAFREHYAEKLSLEATRFVAPAQSCLHCYWVPPAPRRRTIQKIFLLVLFIADLTHRWLRASWPDV